MKNMKENNQIRKLKITKENKIEKIFKHLHSKNEDADQQITKYKQQYQNKKLSNSVQVGSGGVLAGKGADGYFSDSL
jgi:hypothetical protein